MKKNNLTNQKLMSVMLVGMSTMMSISAPIHAYAQDNEITTSGTGSEETNVSTTQPQEQITEEAQEQAKDTLEAIETAQNEVDIIDEAPAQPKEVGELADEEVKAVDDAVTELNEEDHLKNAHEKIEEVQTDLQEAEKANTEADEEAIIAVDKVASATEAADEIEKEVTEANETAEVLLKNIENAENPDDAKDASDKLVKLITDTTEDVELKKDYFDKLTEQYDTAKGKLETAEDNYEKALNEASGDVETAKEELDKAQTNVDTLESVVELANADLKKESDASAEVNSSKKNVEDNWDASNKRWELQRNYMYSVIANYYIPQYIDSGATNIKFKYQKGFDQQDYNYNIVTYTDSNKVEHTFYINYDRADKQKSDDRYNNNALGYEKDIVIYLKSQEEVDANAYLKKYFAGQTISSTDLHKNANAGDYDVFAYDLNGTTQYMVRKELTDAISDGKVTEKQGILYYGESQIHEVVQNQNSMVNGGAYAVNTKDDEKFVAFRDNASKIQEKFEKYDEAVEKAQGAVADAKKEAETLADTIDNLKENRTNRIVKAAEVLGVKDIASFLGIEVTEDEALSLNDMTINQAIKFLDGKLTKAKEKVEEAEADLNVLKGKKEEGEAKLEAVIDKYTEEEPGVEKDDSVQDGIIAEDANQEEKGQEVEEQKEVKKEDSENKEEEKEEIKKEEKEEIKKENPENKEEEQKEVKKEDLDNKEEEKEEVKKENPENKVEEKEEIKKEDPENKEEEQKEIKKENPENKVEEKEEIKKEDPENKTEEPKELQNENTDNSGSNTFSAMDLGNLVENNENTYLPSDINVVNGNISQNNAGGVLGARVNNQEQNTTQVEKAGVKKNITDGQAPKAAKVPTTKNIKTNKKLQKIADPETPLSSTPFEEMEEGFSWWWLALVAAFAVVVKEALIRQKEKKMRRKQRTK